MPNKLRNPTNSMHQHTNLRRLPTPLGSRLVRQCSTAHDQRGDSQSSEGLKGDV